VVDAIAHIDVKTPRLSKERFVAGGAAAIAVAGGIVLGIRLRFHDHTPAQTSILLAFHQTATNQLRSHHLSRAAEEGIREG
jgi:multisubunit Na+/H+ antiporter MnhG subunit